MANLIKVAIFDIDGCLSDDRPRRHLLPSKEQDGSQEHDAYKAYNDKMEDDLAIPSSLMFFKQIEREMRAQGGKITFFTARPVEYILQTFRWLSERLGVDFADPFYGGVHMRPHDNKQSSVDLKRNMLERIADFFPNNKEDVFEVVFAADDRPDVIAMYRNCGVPATLLSAENGPVVGVIRDYLNGESSRSAEQFSAGVSKILKDAAETYDARNAQYKYNAEKVGNVMAAMFPSGVTLRTPGDFHMFHLFELMMVKATRFANSGLRHTDSMRDCGVYSFMCENLVDEHSIDTHQEK